MGIKQLTKLLNEVAPTSVKEIALKELMSRKVAIDASNFIYQFLVAVRSAEAGGASVQLTNEHGEVTSHLQGMFSRSIRLLEAGIKPVFVFDGKAPDMKAGELQKRREIKAKAEADLKAAEEAGSAADIERFSKRTVRMTGEHQEDCKKLLRLMGFPVVEAPCEAEAQCAALARDGHVWGAASEDMDTLTFKAPILVRRISISEARKQPILQFNLPIALEGLGLTYEQFVDLCILCGCDYTSTIKGIGPKKALAAIQKHKTIEGVIKSLEGSKHIVPDDFNFSAARNLFLHHEVDTEVGKSLKWVPADEEGVTAFLCGEKAFSAPRVASGLERLKKAKAKGGQKRMDSFFKLMPGAGAGAGKGKGKGTKRPGKGKDSAKGKKRK